MRITVLVLISLNILLTGCGDGTKGTIDPAFQSYLDQFIRDAALYEREIETYNLTIQFIDKFDDAFLWANCTDGTITIRRDYWYKTKEDTRESLIYHELGHCVLGRDHTQAWNTDLNIPLSLMVQGTHSRSDYWAANKAYYIAELFTGK